MPDVRDHGQTGRRNKEDLTPDPHRALDQLRLLAGELDRAHPGAAGSLSSGEMALRWTAAGMLEAERQFRRIIGYRDLAPSPS